jgi:hypothetical protein
MSWAWMTELFQEYLANRPLHQITVPGTHDAGCYFKRKGYLEGQALTQTQTIRQQLDGGIRYFDLRPYVDGQGKYWTYHGSFYTGDQMDGDAGILVQVSDFMGKLGNSHREMVILNISHFSKFTNDAHRKFIDVIRATLKDHLLPFSQEDINLFDLPYAKLLDRSRVAILYDGALDMPTEAYVRDTKLPAGFFKISPKYNYISPNTPIPDNKKLYLFDQYAGQVHLDDGRIFPGVRSDQLKKLRERSAYSHSNSEKWSDNCPGGVPATLHLFSWTLTPQTRGGEPISCAQTESNPQLLPLLTGKNWGGPKNNRRSYDPRRDEKINIIYVDHYASHVTNGAFAVDGVSGPAGLLIPKGTAVPVAIAARLNGYRVEPAFNWTVQCEAKT